MQICVAGIRGSVEPFRFESRRVASRVRLAEACCERLALSGKGGGLGRRHGRWVSGSLGGAHSCVVRGRLRLPLLTPQLIEPLLHLSRCVARGRTCLERLLPLPRQCRHPRFGAVEGNPLLTKAPVGIGGDRQRGMGCGVGRERDFPARAGPRHCARVHTGVFRGGRKRYSGFIHR